MDNEEWKKIQQEAMEGNRQISKIHRLATIANKRRKEMFIHPQGVARYLQAQDKFEAACEQFMNM